MKSGVSPGSGASRVPAPGAVVNEPATGGADVGPLTPGWLTPRGPDPGVDSVVDTDTDVESADTRLGWDGNSTDANVWLVSLSCPGATVPTCCGAEVEETSVRPLELAPLAETVDGVDVTGKFDGPTRIVCVEMPLPGKVMLDSPALLPAEVGGVDDEGCPVPPLIDGVALPIEGLPETLEPGWVIEGPGAPEVVLSLPVPLVD